MHVIALNETVLIDLTPKEFMPLGKKNLAEILSLVSSFYMICKDQVDFVVGAMVINLKISDGGCENSSQISIYSKYASHNMPMDTTRNIARQFQSELARKSGVFYANELNVSKSSASSLKSAPKNRLKRKTHAAIDTSSKTQKQASVMLLSV